MVNYESVTAISFPKNNYIIRINSCVPLVASEKATLSGGGECLRITKNLQKSNNNLCG